MNCPVCGNAIGPGAAFCTNCGAKVPAQSNNAQETEKLHDPEATTVLNEQQYNAVFGNNNAQYANTQQNNAQYANAQQNNAQFANTQYNAQFANNQFNNAQYANNQFNAQFANVQQNNAFNAAAGAPNASSPNNQGPALKLATDRGMLKAILFTLLTFGIYSLVMWNKIAAEIDISASRYDGKRTMPFFAMLFLSPFTLCILSLVWIHNISNRIGSEVKRRGYDYKFSASTFWLWNVLGSLILVGPFVYFHKLLKSMNLINESFNRFG